MDRSIIKTETTIHTRKFVGEIKFEWAKRQQNVLRLADVSIDEVRKIFTPTVSLQVKVKFALLPVMKA